MIYEINGKPYVKVENFYAEVEVLTDRMIPAKNYNKIYDDEVKESEIKIYNSIQEYNDRQKKDLDLDMDLDFDRPKRSKIK